MWRTSQRHSRVSKIWVAVTMQAGLHQARLCKQAVAGEVVTDDSAAARRRSVLQYCRTGCCTAAAMSRLDAAALIDQHGKTDIGTRFYLNKPFAA